MVRPYLRVASQLWDLQQCKNTYPTPTGRTASLELMVDLASYWSVSIVSTAHDEGMRSNI